MFRTLLIATLVSALTVDVIAASQDSMDSEITCDEFSEPRELMANASDHIRYDGVSFYQLDHTALHPEDITGESQYEWFPWVLEHLNEADVNARVRNTFAEFQRLGVNLIRLVIAPHWWDDEHWDQQGLCHNNRPFDFPVVYLDFDKIYPHVSDYQTPMGVQDLDRIIARVNQLMNIAGEYGLSTSITFTPPQVCTGANLTFIDLERDKAWLEYWMEGIENNGHLVLVNLLSDMRVTHPAGHEYRTSVLHSQANYSVQAPLFLFYPNAPASSYAANNGAWIVDLWSWFKTRFPDAPATFEFPTYAAEPHTGYNTKLMRDTTNWMVRHTPDVFAGSGVLYMNVNLVSSQDDLVRAGCEMADAYFDSLLYRSTGMPLWVDEYGVELFQGLQGDPGYQDCISRETCTVDENVQTDYTEAILYNTQGSPDRDVLGRVIWFHIFSGYDYSADPAGVPVVKDNYRTLFEAYFDIPADSDTDNIPDVRDNCLDAANEDQRDTDGDGHGNICDGDLNNDCIVNFVDYAMFTDDFLALGDLDSDLNGDGVVNFSDFALFPGLFLAVPGPSASGALCN